jgi:hypothetical protein
MSKEKIKQEIKSLSKEEINEIKEFVEHLSTGDSKGSSNEHSFEDKKIVQVEHSHKKAAEFLEKVENIINKQENAEEILMRLNTEVYNLDGSRFGAPNFLEGLSWAIHKCVSSNKKDDNNIYSEFKIIQLLENIYQEKPFTKYYTQEMHEEYFQKGISLAYENSNEEVREVLGDVYSDYLQSYNY